MKILLTMIVSEDADKHPCSEVEIDDDLLSLVAPNQPQPTKNIVRAKFLAEETMPYINAMLDLLEDEHA